MATWGGRLGSYESIRAGNPVAEKDMRNAIDGIITVARGLWELVADDAGGKIAHGAVFESGDEVPAGGVVVLVESYPVYRAWSSAKTITFTDTDGELALYAVIAERTDPAADGEPAAHAYELDAVDLVAQLATDPAPAWSLRLGTGTATSSSFDDFTETAGIRLPLAASDVENDSGVTGATVKEALDALVSSVFGRTGAVVAAASDYDASQVDNDSGVSGSTVKDALDALEAAAAAAVGSTTFVVAGDTGTAQTIGHGDVLNILGEDGDALQTVAADDGTIWAVTRRDALLGPPTGGTPSGGDWVVGQRFIDASGAWWWYDASGYGGAWVQRSHGRLDAQPAAEDFNGAAIPTGYTYHDTTARVLYRWSGTAWEQVTSQLALGVRLRVADGAELPFPPAADSDAARGAALSAAFAAAGEGDTIIVPPGSYAPADTLAIQTKQRIILDGAEITAPDDLTDLLLAANANDWHIEGTGTLIGTLPPETLVTQSSWDVADQAVVRLTGNCTRWSIRGISIWQAVGAGIAHQADGAGLIEGVDLIANGFGLWLGTGGEYSRVRGNLIYSNGVGLRCAAGNLECAGNIIYYQIGDGAQIVADAGPNPGHGILVGNHFTHNGGYGVNLDFGGGSNAWYGMTVAENHIIGNTLGARLAGCGGVLIRGGYLNAGALVLDGLTSRCALWDVNLLENDVTITADPADRALLEVARCYYHDSGTSAHVPSAETDPIPIALGGTGALTALAARAALGALPTYTGPDAPGSPSDGETWYDTTERILWEYRSDVSAWLQTVEQVMTLPLNVLPPYSASAGNAIIGRLPTDHNVYLETVEITGYSGTGTWDATNKWDFVLYKVGTSLGTAAKTSSGVTHHSIAVNALIATASYPYLRVDLVKAGGTEGNLTDYLPVVARFRLARQ